MAKKLIDYDRLTGIKTFHDYDHSSKKTFLFHEQDVESILRHNKIAQNAGTHSKNQDYKHFARVPLTVLMKWKDELGIDWNKPEDLPRIEKLLMSNEYKYLRTVDRI